MTKAEVRQLLALLGANWPEKEIPKQTVRLYELTLADIPWEIGRAAALHVIATRTFWPRIAEIRAAAVELQLDPTVPDAGTAWAEVVRAFSHCGYYRMPEWSHPLIGKTVDAVGGWHELCRSENGVADRARFLDIYEGYRRRLSEQVQMLPEVRELAARLGAGEQRLLEGE